jgi:hypothetical protein
MINNTFESNSKMAAKENKAGIGIIVYLFYIVMSVGYIVIKSQVNKEIVTTGFIITTAITIGLICWLRGFKDLYKVAVMIGAGIIIFCFVITKEDIQRKYMSNKYDYYIGLNSNFENTDNAHIIKEAIDAYSNENYNKALAVIKNRDQNNSETLDRVFNLANVIKELTPELKGDLKVALKDNFVSIEEYKILKLKTVENIQAKIDTLTTEQLILLGSIK